MHPLREAGRHSAQTLLCFAAGGGTVPKLFCTETVRELHQNCEVAVPKLCPCARRSQSRSQSGFGKPQRERQGGQIHSSVREMVISSEMGERLGGGEP